MKLYELNPEIEKAIESYYNCFDEDWVIISEEELEKVQKELYELQNKKDDWINWILEKRQNVISDTNSIDQEIKRLQELKTVKNKEVWKLENFVEMMTKNDYKWKAINIWNFQVKYTKSQAVIISDDSKIPDDCKKFVEEQIIPASYKTDKTILKKMLKDKEIEWCYIENRLKLKIV